ncbi:unnamed protein product [Closterium sp. NIES-64]|nr:unnamed protein product [Closterium sp. NIES-64]
MVPDASPAPNPSPSTSSGSAPALSALSPAPLAVAALTAPSLGLAPSLAATAAPPNSQPTRATAYASVASGSNLAPTLPASLFASPTPGGAPRNLRRARTDAAAPMLFPLRRRAVINTVGDPYRVARRVYGRLLFSLPSQEDAAAFRKLFPLTLKVSNSRPLLLKVFEDRFAAFTTAKAAGAPTLSIRNVPLDFDPEDIRSYLLGSTDSDGAHWLADLTDFHRVSDPYEDTYFTHLAGLPIATPDDPNFERIPSEIPLEENKPPMVLNFSSHVCALCANNHRASDHEAFAARRRQRLTNRNVISVAQLQKANELQFSLTLLCPIAASSPSALPARPPHLLPTSPLWSPRAPHSALHSDISPPMLHYPLALPELQFSLPLLCPIVASSPPAVPAMPPHLVSLNLLCPIATSSPSALPAMPPHLLPTSPLWSPRAPHSALHFDISPPLLHYPPALPELQFSLTLLCPSGASSPLRPPSYATSPCPYLSALVPYCSPFCSSFRHLPPLFHYLPALPKLQLSLTLLGPIAASPPSALPATPSHLLLASSLWPPRAPFSALHFDIPPPPVTLPPRSPRVTALTHPALSQCCPIPVRPPSYVTSPPPCLSALPPPGTLLCLLPLPPTALSSPPSPTALSFPRPPCNILGNHAAPTTFRNDPGLIYIGLDDKVETWTCALCDFTCGAALDSAMVHIQSELHASRVKVTAHRPAAKEAFGPWRALTLQRKPTVAAFLRG